MDICIKQVYLSLLICLERVQNCHELVAKYLRMAVVVQQAEISIGCKLEHIAEKD